MKLRTSCVVCVQTAALNTQATQQIPIQLLAIRDDGTYDLSCPKGHEYELAIQGTKYEMLYDLALNAYHDGYYRETISTFAASLERFFEFFIKTLFHLGSQSPLFTDCWPLVAAMSERQLGAYAFCSALHFSAKPKILSTRSVKLRNRVIHKGYFPNADEALAFGQDVCDIIVSGLDQIYERHGDSFRDFYYSQMPSAAVGTKPRAHYVMIGIRWEDIKFASSPIRKVRNSLERMFGPEDSWNAVAEAVASVDAAFLRSETSAVSRHSINTSVDYMVSRDGTPTSSVQIKFQDHFRKEQLLIVESASLSARDLDLLVRVAAYLVDAIPPTATKQQLPQAGAKPLHRLGYVTFVSQDSAQSEALPIGRLYYYEAVSEIQADREHEVRFQKDGWPAGSGAITNRLRAWVRALAWKAYSEMLAADTAIPEA